MRPVQRHALWILTFFLLVVFSQRAAADGKVFARAAGPVRVPDQRAMLHYSNGVERLVIETSFIGRGTNFGWVIPLPSPPKIEAVSTNFFRSLERAFQPRLIYEATGWWILIVISGAAIAAGIHYRRTPGRRQGILAFALCFAASLLLGLAFVVPSFVKARGLSTISKKPADVTVLNRQQVGVYDTVTLSSLDGGALVSWLKTHDFDIPASALPVITAYATQNWFFVAATIRRDADSVNKSQPHPLAFTFPTREPLYPLRLTGIDNDDCTIELFVFGPERAEIPGFKVEYCGQPSVPVSGPIDTLIKNKVFFGPSDPGEYALATAELRDFAMPAAVTTKLVGTLTSRQMETDARIKWIPFRPAVLLLHSKEAALDRALTLFTGLAVVGMLLVQLAAPRLRRRTCWYALSFVIVVAATSAAVRWRSAEITDVEFSHRGWRQSSYELRALNGSIEHFIIERKTTTTPVSFAEFKGTLDGYIRGGLKNAFTDEPIREEASPGNITLRTSLKAVEVLWHDFHGTPHLIATIPVAAK